MLFVRYKCSRCKHEFKALRLLVDSETKKRCPKCEQGGILAVEDDLRVLKLDEKSKCSSFG